MGNGREQQPTPKILKEKEKQAGFAKRSMRQKKRLSCAEAEAGAVGVLLLPPPQIKRPTRGHGTHPAMGHLLLPAGLLSCPFASPAPLQEAQAFSEAQGAAFLSASTHLESVALEGDLDLAGIVGEHMDLHARRRHGGEGGDNHEGLHVCEVEKRKRGRGAKSNVSHSQQSGCPSE